MDLGPLTVDHHRLRAKAYTTKYLRHFEAREPVKEWDDRIRLYSLKEIFINSGRFPGTQFRQRYFAAISSSLRMCHWFIIVNEVLSLLA